MVKEVQAIRDDVSSTSAFLEGPRLVEEVLKSKLSIQTLILALGLPPSPLIDDARRHSKKMFRVSESVFLALSDVRAPQGIIAIVERPAGSWQTLLARRPAPVIVLDGIQDSGNAAAILRTAEAAGAAGVVTTPGTARLFSPKALRGAMGSTLRLPILEHQSVETIIENLRSAGVGLLGTVSEPSAQSGAPVAINFTSVDWSQPWAIVLGQEGQGLSLAWEPALSKTIFIPMSPPVESLNVAAAAAILLYESRSGRTENK